MKISEMQNKLETLQNKLYVIYETTNAVAASLDQEILKADQVGFAMSGITDSIDSVIDDIGLLVEESIKMREVVENL